ncbi:MAG: carboxypeptidase regulatory-like domain-containing protein [Byssovorax sp.]
MHRRDLASLAALATLALTVGVGCPEDKPAGTTGGAKPAQTAKPTAAVTATATSTGAAAPGKEGPMGTASIKGAVNFTGKAPEMKVPKKRKDADFCKTKEVKYNAVVVNNGKLAETLVRLTNDSVKGEYKAPDKHAEIDQVDCMYAPRIQGVVAGQEIDIKNADGTLHNVHTFKGNETWFNQAQPKGSVAISKELEDTKLIKFVCDVHPWMRGFVVVSSHPFFAVSGADGTFAIEKVPAGKYTIEAWHPHYGQKTAQIEVADGKAVEQNFTYDGTEQEPIENKDELKDLF